MIVEFQATSQRNLSEPATRGFSQFIRFYACFASAISVLDTQSASFVRDPALARQLSLISAVDVGVIDIEHGKATGGCAGKAIVESMRE